MQQQEQETSQLSQERGQNESRLWYERYLLYRDAGSGRTLRAVFMSMQATKSPKKPARHVSGAWKQAYEKWQWYARATAYDEEMHAREQARRAALYELEQAEIEKILTTGYAAKHERVKVLGELVDTLEKSFTNEDGSINFKLFTPEKIEQIRGCFADIAKELGHRIHKREISGPGGAPMEFITNWAGGALDEDDTGKP